MEKYSGEVEKELQGITGKLLELIDMFITLIVIIL